MTAQAANLRHVFFAAQAVRVRRQALHGVLQAGEIARLALTSPWTTAAG